MKRILAVSAVVLAALGAGWVWGAWGRSGTEAALQAAALQRRLLEARAAILDARLDIYTVNFGNASQHFEAARTLLQDAQEQLRDAGRQDDANRLDHPLARITEAQRMAGNLDQGAQPHAAAAASGIDEVGERALRSWPLRSILMTHSAIPWRRSLGTGTDLAKRQS